MPGEMIPIFLFGIMGLVGIAYSPVGRAFGRLIGGDKADPEVGELKAEIAELREQVTDLESRLHGELDEVQNRLDFAERVIAQAKAKDALPGGR